MRRPLYKHYAAAFCLDCAAMLSITSTPFYIFDRLGGDERTSGTILALMSIIYAIVCLTSAGALSRIHHGLRVSAFGALGSGAFFGAASFVQSTVAFTVLSMCAMAALALAWPSMHAWLGGEQDVARRTQWVSKFNISWSAGLAVGTLGSGLLYDLNFHLPYVSTLCFAAVAAILLWTQPHESDYFGDSGNVEEQDCTEDPKAEALLYCTWIALVVGWCLMGASRAVFPKRLDELAASGDLVLLWPGGPGGPITVGSASLFSLLSFSLALTSVIVFFVMGRSQFWMYRFGPLLVLQFITGCAFWALGTTSSLAVMALCYALIGANTYFAFFTSICYGISSFEHRRRRSAINESLVGIGSFIGSILFGWLASLGEVATPFLYTPVAVALLVALEYAVYLHQRRDPATET